MLLIFFPNTSTGQTLRSFETEKVVLFQNNEGPYIKLIPNKGPWILVKRVDILKTSEGITGSPLLTTMLITNMTKLGHMLMPYSTISQYRFWLISAGNSTKGPVLVSMRLISAKQLSDNIMLNASTTLTSLFKTASNSLKSTAAEILFLKSSKLSGFDIRHYHGIYLLSELTLTITSCG